MSMVYFYLAKFTIAERIFKDGFEEKRAGCFHYYDVSDRPSFGDYVFGPLTKSKVLLVLEMDFEGLEKVEFYRPVEAAIARKYRIPGGWLNEHAYLYGFTHPTTPIDEEQMMAEIFEHFPP